MKLSDSHPRAAQANNQRAIQAHEHPSSLCPLPPCPIPGHRCLLARGDWIDVGSSGGCAPSTDPIPAVLGGMRSFLALPAGRVDGHGSPRRRQRCCAYRSDGRPGCTSLSTVRSLRLLWL
ncbi:unnamed protein product [Urochloa humidicola]